MKITTLGLICLAMTAGSVFAQNVKPAIFNFQNAFDSYYKTSQGLQQLEAGRSQLQEQIQGLQQQLQTLASEIQQLEEEAENPAFSSDAQEEKRKRAEEKRQRGAELQQQAQQWQQAFQRQQILFRQEIIDDITDVAKSIAGEHGANLLIDSSPSPNTGVPQILSYDENWDITQEVINELNKDAPPENASSEG